MELEVASLPAANRALSFEVRMGADPLVGDPFRQRGGHRVSLVFDRYGNAAVQPEAKIWYSRRDGLIGTWRFARTGKLVTVTTPRGDTAAWDRSEDPEAWGNGIQLVVPAPNNDPGFRIGGLRLLAGGAA